MHNRNNKANPNDKANNFSQSIKRLFSELKRFHFLIIISLILASLSSILSIVAPDQLSNLTDTISNGLVVNTKNLEEISTTVMQSLTEEKLKNIIPSILDIKINKETTNKIITSNDISEEDKQTYQEFIKNIYTNKNNIIIELSKLPTSILSEILLTTTYENETITTEDKINLVKSLEVFLNKEYKTNITVEIPQSVGKIIFDEFKLKNKTITENDQVEFVNIMSNLDKDTDTTELYSNLDKLPTNIKKLVEPTMNMDKIKNIALILALLYIASTIFNFIQSISMTIISNKFANLLRQRISIKINKLPLKYFDKHQSGDILSRITNDVDTIAQSMNQSLATLVSASTLFIGTIIMMFVTNWIMALTAIISSLLGFVFMFTILGKSQKYFVSRQVELGNLNSHIEEIYSGLNVVKAYNGKKESDKKFDELNYKVYECNRMSQFLSGLMHPMMGFVGNLGYVAVCIVGALLTINDMITFGTIVAFITYVRLFTNPLNQIAQAMTSLQSTAAASERVFEFIDEEEMREEEHIKTKLNKKKVKGKIEFENVVFKYDGNDKPTIKNFSAKALPGQKIAIVGPTGAGKTTMVNLLMKFYEINEGDIKIDGVSTKELTRENIHELFTMVLQDTWLFNGTIKENIIYNRKNISNKRVEEVCKIVGIDHFINTQPNGYDSVINDNDSVSAGQRQLMTIARGMLEDAPFLILDEATSNVDTRTEELVQKAMDKLTEGKTSFIIAHRLSTIKNADLILVMKDGNIIETGNHKELIKKNGFYAEIYNSQFQNQ